MAVKPGAEVAKHGAAMHGSHAYGAWGALRGKPRGRPSHSRGQARHERCSVQSVCLRLPGRCRGACIRPGVQAGAALEHAAAAVAVQLRLHDPAAQRSVEYKRVRQDPLPGHHELGAAGRVQLVRPGSQLACKHLVPHLQRGTSASAWLRLERATMRGREHASVAEVPAECIPHYRL